MTLYGLARLGPELPGGGYSYTPTTYGHEHEPIARGHAAVVTQRRPDSSELDRQWRLVPSDHDVDLAVDEFFYRQDLLFAAAETRQAVELGPEIESLIETLGDQIPQGAVIQAQAAWTFDPRRGEEAPPWLVINVGLAPENDLDTLVNLSLSSRVSYRPDVMSTLTPDELDPYVIYMGVVPHPDADIAEIPTQAVYEIARR